MMDKYIYDKNNGLWYKLQGDYYLPCLTLLTEEEKPIGLWGSGIYCITSSMSGCSMSIC